MFHPLLPEFTELKDLDIENKINELGKKYSISARTGNGGLCSQILMVMEQYKEELRRRMLEKTKIAVKNKEGGTDFDDLININ
jgi:hypothetical protein